jgi:5-methylthioribose kinase
MHQEFGEKPEMSDYSAFAAADLLTALGWMPAGRHVTAVAIAGVGNMNLVERVTLDDGATLILKRARAWVEKYPDIPAPVSRARVEAAFYQAVHGRAAGDAMPAHLGFDQASAANLFADLGEGSDGMGAYGGQAISETDLDGVVDWMGALHALPVPADSRFDNRAMRELNALHIFDFPLDPNSGFNVDAITPGLQKVADRLKHDGDFVAAVQAAKALYLGDAPGVLLHGDLYPGSWLKTPKGLFVIDPEFCWIGPPEWDLGVLTAHLWLSGQSPTLVDRLVSRYGGGVDRQLMNKICGIEIMRRLIGVAQLPLTLDLAAKMALLDQARTLVLGKAL